ncbi:TPA: hypothetical protein ACQNZU_001768, partial [Streptococcus pyogenes]
VYENEQSDEVNEILENKIKFIVTKFQGGSKDKDILIKNLDKIKNNYMLAQVQKEFIVENSKITRDGLKQIRKSTDNLEKQSNRMEKNVRVAEKELKQFKKTKSQIYTDFVTILGVFSSFVFIMFGGFSALSTMIGALSTTEVSIGKTLVISSILLGFLLILIYSMLSWISIIIDKPIPLNCCSCNGNKLKHIGNTFLNNGYFFFLLIICVLCFMLGNYFK